jgi:antitoxin (DNA-binding transcriptional repressor) of toxin-antitoxin stability system
MERQLGITEARKQLAQMIDQVEYRGETWIIVRHG